MNQFLDINFIFLSMKNSIHSLLKFTYFYSLFVGIIIIFLMSLKI